MAEYKYKDSGVAWIGEIPDHWDTIKLKYTSWLKGRIGWQGLTSDEYQDEGPYLITGTDFKDGKINWDTCVRISEERYEEDSDIHIHEGDLLITKDGTIGKVAVAKNCPEKVSLNSGVMLIRNTKPFKYHDQYLYYVLLSDEFWLWYEMNQTGASTIRHLYQEQFYNFEFSYPPIEEQKEIASYLDEKVAGINESIKTLLTTIEDYRKWKQSIIYEAVTKGLNKDVDMVDSGIDIIGLKPKKWKLSRLKYLCEVMTGNQDTQNADPEGEYPFYVRSPIVERNREYTYEGEGILMAGDGAGAGRVFHHAYGKYAIHQRVYCFHDFKGINTDYFFYFIQELFKMVMDKGSAQSTVPSVRLPMITNFYFCIPSEEEQEQIVAFLDDKCKQIDALIEEKEQLIIELQDYKKSLIFEVVSGKRKVV